ncbi:MAG TPA: MMPL family transporter, partial [archaeon]|nr:MMPL family transporter [archaeon]
MKILEKVSEIQYNHAKKIALISIIITLIFAIGILNIRLQTDFNKEMPQDLDVIELQNSVSEKFGGLETILVLVQFDKENYYANSPTDIRDPKIIRTLISLEELIKEDSKVSNIQSVGNIFSSLGYIPNDTQNVSMILNQLPQTNTLFNKNYSATMMLVSVDLKKESEIESFISDLKEKINAVEKPSGVKISITGNTPIRSIILVLLQEDLIFTTMIAAIIIFLLILVYKKSLSEAVLVFIPLIIGLIWMLGIMGHLNVPLSIATVGVSAMILGLGTEYGIFLLERYQEEREKDKSIKESMKIALPAVGSGIIGSGTTTIVGFLALTISVMPMLKNLGIILALGISCILIATILIAPVFVIIEEELFR